MMADQQAQRKQCNACGVAHEAQPLTDERLALWLRAEAKLREREFGKGLRYVERMKDAADRLDALRLTLERVQEPTDAMRSAAEKYVSARHLAGWPASADDFCAGYVAAVCGKVKR